MTLQIAPDRRRLEAEPDLAAHERAVALAKGFVEHQLGLARELGRIAATKTYLHFDCASIEEYGARIGLRWRDAHLLVELGHALGAVLPGPFSEPEAGGAKTVEEALREGAIPLDNAALAGRLLAKPELVRPGEDPVEIAMTHSPTRMRQIVREREEEAAQQQPVTPLSLCVTSKAKEGFARARAVASEQAGTMLTEGETFAVVVEHYLECMDPLRRGEGPRRLPDTAELPGQRYIPAEVRRAVRLRSGDRCEVPGCPHDVFLEFAHIDVHSCGGSREADNLLRLCRRHHVLFDAERIRFGGWHEGRPTFRDSSGRLLTHGATLAAGNSGRPGYEPPSEASDRNEPGTGQVGERPPPEWGGADDASETAHRRAEAGVCARVVRALRR